MAAVLSRHAEPVEIGPVLGALDAQEVVVCLPNRLQHVHVVEVVAELGWHCRRSSEEQRLLTARVLGESLLKRRVRHDLCVNSKVTVWRLKLGFLVC